MLPYSLAFLKIKAGLYPIKDKTKFPVALPHFLLCQCEKSRCSTREGKMFYTKKYCNGKYSFSNTENFQVKILSIEKNVTQTMSQFYLHFFFS